MLEYLGKLIVVKHPILDRSLSIHLTILIIYLTTINFGISITWIHSILASIIFNPISNNWKWRIQAIQVANIIYNFIIVIFNSCWNISTRVNTIITYIATTFNNNNICMHMYLWRSSINNAFRTSEC